MADAIKTYNPKEVVVACGTHIVSGYADDSFISIEPNGDGITKKVGCDGEIARSISPDNTYKVKITLLQNSDPIRSSPILLTMTVLRATVFSRSLSRTCVAVCCLQLRQRGSSRSLPLLVARKPTTASGKSTLHLLS